MRKKQVKVAITGAAGHIGYSLLFRIANGDIFGQDTEVIFQLLELETALRPLEGTVMELMDCAFPLLKDVHISSDVNKVMNGVNWAILVGSVPRKVGMERSDLLSINGQVFIGQGKAINDHAAEDVRVFVVGNPCNTNCMIAMNHAPDVPKDRFHAMTTLDENRAKAQLAAKAGVRVTDVSHMIIWGNHSPTMYPDFYHAKIQGKPVLDMIQDETWLKTDFMERIQKRGTEVLQARGASSAASAAQAVIDGVRYLVFPTEQGQIYSSARCSKGEYGVDEGLIFSYPCITADNHEVSVVTGWEHNTFAEEKLQATLQELRQERDIVKSMGLISA